MNAIVPWTGKHLDLVRKTVAKDCDPAEFDQFMHICKAVRLDPLRRQIYAFVFNKDEPGRRQMTIVTAIGGYRSIAERTGNYRPGPTQTVIDDSLRNEDTNPLGIVYGEATVFKFSHGEWYPFTESAYWDEYAPIVEDSEDGFDWEPIPGQFYPTGHAKAGKQKHRKVPRGATKPKLDPGKKNWRRMARTMIEKCAEAKALRRGWPDDFEGIYGEEEIDRAHTIDLTATEIADEAASEAKLALIGGKDALTVLWDQGSKLERVPSGRFCDAVLEWTRAKDRTATELLIWWKTNEAARAEYKARHGAEYLEFQKAFEARGLELESSDLINEAAE